VVMTSVIASSFLCKMERPESASLIFSSIEPIECVFVCEQHHHDALILIKYMILIKYILEEQTWTTAPGISRIKKRQTDTKYVFFAKGVAFKDMQLHLDHASVKEFHTGNHMHMTAFTLPRKINK
jgi:hypothetical protein